MSQPLNIRILAMCSILLLCPCIAQGEEWPIGPERSGLSLPGVRNISLLSAVDGAYVPKIGDLSSGRSWVTQANILWNFTLFDRFGIFGSHMGGAMGWSNVLLLMFANEAGIRIVPKDFFSIEAAYLNHRVDTTWVDGKKIYPAGIIDHGAELGTWFEINPIKRIKIKLHLYGRYFSVYTEHHGVLGTTAKVCLLPADGHELALSADFLEVWRANARAGVDKFTHNTIGTITWTSMLNQKVGILAKIMVSTNLLVGKMPMLELRRSMIGEPMGLLTLGMFVKF